MIRRRLTLFTADRLLPLCVVAMPAFVVVSAEELIDIPTDLSLPVVVEGAPTPGKRVRRTLSGYESGSVHHLLYLPVDWKPGGRFPVVVEYAGNRWRNSPGTVEGSHLGYGLSGGRGVIWACLPFVDTEKQKNARRWWGDLDATVDYCRRVVRRICEQWGGDESAVFIAGFSRGAIACNYIGLHDDGIASLWRGFICHSHYDGVRNWPYDDSGRVAAAKRLERLGDRPQFISHEGSTAATERYLNRVYPEGNFTFLALPFPDHTDTWVMRDLPARETLRRWFRRVLEAGVQSAHGSPSR